MQGEIAAFKEAAPQFPITYQIWESSHSLTVRPCTLNCENITNLCNLNGLLHEVISVRMARSCRPWQMLTLLASLTLLQKSQEIDFVVKWGADQSFRG